MSPVVRLAQCCENVPNPAFSLTICGGVHDNGDIDGRGGFHRVAGDPCEKELGRGAEGASAQRPFSKITVEDICATVRAPTNGVSARAKSFGFCSSRSVTGDKSARPAAVLMMKKRVQ